MGRSEISRAVENIAALNKRDAASLADRIIDGVIDALRRDPAIPPRSFADWSLVLADLRPRVAEQIDDVIGGHVNREKVLTTLGAMP